MSDPTPAAGGLTEAEREALIRAWKPVGVGESLVEAVEQILANRCSPVDGDVAAAIATVEDSRRTHVEWRDYWHRTDGWEDCEGCREKAAGVGGPDHHERCITEYDNVLAVLRRTEAADRALAVFPDGGVA